MTEWLGATEAEVLHEVDKRLREAGWFVFITSQDKATRRHVSGFPDRIAFRNGHTLLIEGKTASGSLNAAQIRFYQSVFAHLGSYLHYEVVRHPQQVEPYCEENKDESQ